MKNKLVVVEADITTLDVDVVVNIANSNLLGGGCVSASIHRAAGPKLREACKTEDSWETGEVRITRGYCLPARYVIHTVGPVGEDGDNFESVLLRSFYDQSLDLALNHDCKTVAFPSFCASVYGYSVHWASAIALDAVISRLKQCPEFEQIIFCCCSKRHQADYQSKLDWLIN